MIGKLFNTIKSEVKDYTILLRSVPCGVMVFFVMSVVLMNLFANKELLNYGWIALDCGFCISWISFLCMDMLTKRFGAKAAIKLSMFAVGVNLVASLVFWSISLIPGNWGAFYTYENGIVNDALNSTIGGTWYVVFGSMVAFAIASIVNAIINSSIGKLSKSNSFAAFAARSYISTAFGQFVDNLIFALLVSHVFFGWTIFQVITCSIAGAVLELLSEVIFSPVGYRVSKRWEADKVGQQYIHSLTHEGVQIWQ